MKNAIIIIRGAPGAGKSSLARRLKKTLPDGVLIEVDNVRGMMNNVNWEDEKEYLIAHEVAIQSTRKFLELERSPVIIVDMFMSAKLAYLLDKMEGTPYKVISLLVSEKVMAKRFSDRKEGFINLEKGIKINNLISLNATSNELIIHTDDFTKTEVAEKVSEFLVELFN